MVNTVKPKFYGFNDHRAEAMPSAAVERSHAYPLPEMINQRPTREGWLTFQSYDHDSQSFRLPMMGEVVTAWLKAQEIEAAPSDAGLVARSMVAAVGGLNWTRLLANEAVLRQFDRMAHTRRERQDGIIEDAPARTATVNQMHSMLKAIDKVSWGPPTTLQRFVDIGALRLGLSVKCDHCGKRNWYDLDEVGAQVTCERCLAGFPFPQGVLPPKDAWRYRVVGPYAVPNLAGGAYGCLLTLNFFRSAMGMAPSMTYMTALDLTNGEEKLETDFFAWHDRDIGGWSVDGPSLLLGECKGFGTDVFKQKDVDRLRRLGEWLPGAFLVAACLKPSLSEDEKERFEALCRWGWGRPRVEGAPPSQVIVLTGSELFDPDGMLRSLEKMEGPVEMNETGLWDLADLAVASQKTYLGFTDEKMDEMRYGRRPTSVGKAQ